MAWGRITELIVGIDNQGLLVSDLDIDFRVERSLTLSENTAEFKIYNAKEDTRNEVLRQDNNVTFRVGYDDEGTSTIFIGNIIEANNVKSGSDYITTIKAVSSRGSRFVINKLPISLSYAPNTYISSILQDIASAMGLAPFGLLNANIKLPNGWVFVGTVNGALRYLKDVLANYRLGIYIDNDELVIYEIDKGSLIDAVVLSFTGGLLSIEDISLSDTEIAEKKAKETKKKKGKKTKTDTRTRYKFRSIIIPQLSINAPVIFDTPELKGTYIVDKLEYSGNNYGGDFNIEGEVSNR